MRAVIFGGTAEGRALCAKLAAMGVHTAVSVATELGREQQGEQPGVRVFCGRLDAGQMAELLRGADICIDATHPYAVEATRNIRAAAAGAAVRYVRLLRAQSALPEGSLIFDSAADAALHLEHTDGNILLATGAKELACFAAIKRERLYPRVLPTHEGIAACEAAGVPHRNIIAMQGPFSREMNEAIIKQFDIKYLVTKDGGAPGGFEQKAQAAQNAGAQLMVLRRPQEQGQTEAEILKLCGGML